MLWMKWPYVIIYFNWLFPSQSILLTLQSYLAMCGVLLYKTQYWFGMRLPVSVEALFIAYSKVFSRRQKKMIQVK
jgi:hypothetical protein